MTAPFLSPGFRATDSDDNPLAGGYINFYAAGTTTPLAVYSEPYVDGSTPSLGTTVNLNSAGAPVSGSNVPVLIYPVIGTDYKMRYYDADDVLIFEFDDIPGAEAAVVASSTATPIMPVISKTTAYTITTDERSKLINANPTGGSFAITLPSAVTVGDNFLVGIRHNGTANSVSLVATGSQNIRFQGNRTAFSLNGQGETLWLVADGSDWIGCGYVPPFRKDLGPYFIVLDSIASPPANPDAGARYRISGTPTGSWSTLGFADEDIAEADGNGSWIKHTPEEGWMAFDVDEKISLIFKDGAWENFQIDPGESTLKTFIVQDQKSSNTDGGTATTDAWTTAVLNTSVVNTITDASLASNKITLPGGPDGSAKRYRARARKVFAVTGEARLRLKKDIAGTVVGLSESIHAGNIVSTNSSNATVAVTAALECEFEITESTDFVLEYYVNVNQASTGTQGLGIPSNISGVVEIYATVTIEDLSAQQGPKGDQGEAGEGLDAAYAYQLNTATSGDPGSGKIRTNHATPASVTQIAVHQTDANGADLTAVIGSWDNSTSTTSKARLRFHKEGDPQNFFEFLITGTGTDQGSYWTFPVSYVSHGGTISNNNDIAMLVVQTGDIGDPGTTVPDIDGLTVKTSPSLTDDYSIIYDDAASSHKKFLPFSRDAGLTIFDSGVWTGAVGQRIGVDLDAIGAGFPGDNEFAFVVAAHTTGPTNSTDRTYKVGILSIAATSDPSESDGSIPRMSVGVDGRGYALDGNLFAHIWGLFGGAYFYPGSDGYGCAGEFELNNFGSGEPSVGTILSKYVLHAVAGGDEPATVGLKFSSGEFIVNTFYYGIHGLPADFTTSFIELDGVHAIKPTGAGGFGTNDPQRMIHGVIADAATNAVSYADRVSHRSSGTVAAGFGIGREWQLENASGNDKIASTMEVKWDVATDAAEYASLYINMISNGSLINAMTLSALGILNVTGYYSVDGVQVLGNRVTGFVTAAGSANKDASAINVGTITASDANIRALSAWVKALHDALATHGAIGA